MALIAVGITILLLAASALPAVGDERSLLMRQPMTPHGVAGTAVRDGRTSLDTAGSEAPTEDRPQRKRVLMNACAGKTTPGYWIEKLSDESAEEINLSRSQCQVKEPYRRSTKI